MNQKKKMAIILASILALMLVGAAVASKIIASDPYRLPSVKHRPTETPVVTAEPTAELTAEPTAEPTDCLLYTSPSPRDRQKSRMPSSA